MTTPKQGQPHPHIKHERMFVEADPERKTHVTRGGKTHLESPWMSVLTHGLRWVVSREGRIVETVRSSQT